MSRLYTRSGDDGSTWCGRSRRRLPKTHPCIEFIGALDEAEAAIGFARSLLGAEDRDIQLLLRDLENLLFRVGFAFAGKSECIAQSDLEALEESIDAVNSVIEPAFSLNGGDAAAAAISLARSITRRAERRLWACLASLPGGPGEVDRLAARILNRLSDMLYAVQVIIARRHGVEPERPSCETRLQPFRPLEGPRSQP